MTIKLVYSKTNVKYGGVPSYIANFYHDLSKEMQYHTDVKLVTIPKIELKFRGKKYGGWKSQDILSFMVGNAHVVHSMSDSELTKYSTVVTIHDIYPLTLDIFKDISQEERERRIGKLKTIYKNNVKVVVQTNEIAKDIRNFIPDADITVIPSKIFTGTPTLNPYPSDGKLHLVTMGEINLNHPNRKQIYELYDWVKDLDNVELYHIGFIENPKYINYAKNIHQLGYVSPEDKWNYLAYADKFVFKTLGEGQGYPVMEAMRLGTQVLINDLPEHRELLGDYFPLYYHDKEEFIEKMWYPPRSGMVEQIRQYDNWIEKYKKVYGYVIK
jgi:glycosyltransferase involved in cell wall biosynthesis